jgi:hypothetical protein
MGSAHAFPIAAGSAFRVRGRGAFTGVKLYVAVFAAFATLAGAGTATALLLPRSSAPAHTTVTPVITTARP